MTAKQPGSLNRRSLFKYGLAVGVGAIALPPVSGIAVGADIAGTGTSQNGWPILRADQVASTIIEGSGAKIALTKGPAGVILRHVVRRFNYELTELGTGDITAFDLGVQDPLLEQSNLASGTAVSILPSFYVPGSRQNFFDTQVIVLRDILAECEGVIKWGGDFESRTAEGYFQIDVPPDSPLITSVGLKISAWDASKDQGAGTQIDVVDPERRQDSLSLASEQQPN